MTDIALDCPHCGRNLEIDASLRGQKIECPACKGEVAIPDGAKAIRVSASAAPPALAEESELFTIKPTAKAFLGSIILGILLSPIVVGLLILLYVWYRMASTRYRLTTQRLFVQKGLVAKHIEEVELFRVKDVTVEQGVLQRILRFGTITVLSSDDTNPQLTLMGINDPVQVKETLRNAFRSARKREGLRTGEFIPS